MPYTYLLINFFTILVPFLFSFHPKIRFDKEWKRFLPAMIIVAVIFILWDIYFTKLGVWNFNPRYVTGIYLSELPLEELLFFICVPYACVFTYYCLDKFFKLDWSNSAESSTCIAFAILLFVIGGLNIGKLYTSVTFISTAIVCLLMQFYFRIKWFGKALTVYAVLLIPFLIVNGLLTGTGLEEAVVRYNNNENLGIRILTIPVEDTVYGFELYILNLFFYQYRTKASIHTLQQA